MAATCVDEVKTEWPELVGELGDVAKETIERENPGLRQVVIVLEGSITDMAIIPDRVRVWVDEEERRYTGAKNWLMYIKDSCDC